MQKKRKVKIGSIVMCRKTKSVGVVVKIIGDKDLPSAFIVKVNGIKKKWTIRMDKEPRFFNALLKNLFNKSS